MKDSKHNIEFGPSTPKGLYTDRTSESAGGSFYFYGYRSASVSVANNPQRAGAEEVIANHADFGLLPQIG